MTHVLFLPSWYPAYPGDISGVFQRQAVARRYHELLGPLSDAPDAGGADATTGWVHLRPWPVAGRSSVFARYTVRVWNREIIRERLQESGDPAAVRYPKLLNEQPVYAHLCSAGCTPVAQPLAAEVMSLPMHPGLTVREQEFLRDALMDASAEAEAE